jgi:hypothetical protein
MKWLFILTVTILTCSSSFAQDKTRKSPDFLFAEDNKAQTAESCDLGLKPKALLKGDEWLNAPLTRLDYIIMNMQNRLTQRATDTFKEMAPEYFEPSPMRWVTPSIDFTVRYYEEKGRLLLIANVSDVGKPKKPMTESCRGVARLIELQYPMTLSGFTWHNSALGILLRSASTDPQYTEAIQKLIDSSLIMVTISSTYKEGETTQLFVLNCRKQNKDSDFEFTKLSGTL